MSKLKEKLMLSEKGYSDLKKAITACTITNIALLLPSMVACLIFWELLKPFTGEAISWAALWKLLGLGVVAAILVFLAAKNDYRKTYIASYKEASTTRLRIAEHLRKLPMSFFNTKDLSDITTNMMADCSSMESMLSSTIPPLIANIISVTLTCVCLAFFDWRMALAIFCTMPVTFLIIWCGRKLQLRLFDKQVDVKLEASSQIQEYLEGIKIIKSCDLGGSRFDALDKALQAMRKIAIKVELASGILVQGASLILQAGLGITIFIGTVLITNGKIELLSLLVLLMFSTQIYGPILAILSQLTSLFHLGTVTNRMRTLLTTPAMEGEDKDVSKYDIELKNVTFGYNQDDVIKDVSFSIPAGSVTALVGPSGSGKSTISKLIARFWDVRKGQITIGGIDVSTIEPEHLMRCMSFVFQDVTLFNDTVFNNIRVGNMNATEEQAPLACQLVLKLRKEGGILMVHIGSEKTFFTKGKDPSLRKYHHQNKYRDEKSGCQAVAGAQDGKIPAFFLPALRRNGRLCKHLILIPCLVFHSLFSSVCFIYLFCRADPVSFPHRLLFCIPGFLSLIRFLNELQYCVKLPFYLRYLINSHKFTLPLVSF